MESAQTTVVDYRKFNRKYSITRSGLGLNGVNDILSCTEESRRYSGVMRKSQIRNKATFIKYLKFCVDKKLIRNWKKPSKHKAGCRETWFVITNKGRLFLEMLE